jgi:hypothetical protein
VEEVPLILTLLDKAVRQHGLYGSDHPLSSGSLTDFHRRLAGFLEKGEPLSLEVRRTHLEWKGDTVFSLQKREGNYIHDMYIDGIRKLDFLPTVTEGELAGLVSVLSRDIKKYQNREEDTVTLLWKKELQGVRYETIDIYAGDLNALLRESFLLKSDDKTPQEERDFLDHFVNGLLRPEDTEDAPSSPMRRLEEEFQADVARPVPNERFDPDPDAALRLREEAMRLAERPLDRELCAVFLEVLWTKADEPAFETLVGACLSRIEDHLRQGLIPAAVHWLTQLRELQGELLKTSSFGGGIIEKEILLRLGGELFTELGQLFASGVPGTPVEWVRLLNALGSGGPACACELLRHLNQEAFRTTLVEFLSDHPPADLDQLLDHLKGTDYRLIRDVVRVLARFTDNELVLPALRHVAIAPNAAVRLEVVRAMRGFREPKAKEVLVRAIRDADGDVRRTALHLISKDPDPLFAKPLAQEITSDRILERDASEKRLTIVTLARCGGTATLPFFEQVIESGGPGLSYQELRVAAVHGIAEVNDRKAREILLKISSKLLLGGDVRNAAKSLLLRKTGAAEGESDA